MSNDRKAGPLKGLLLGGIKLDWIRPLVYRLGGRKLLAGAGSLAVINEIVKSETSDTVKIVACISAGIVAIGISLSIALEDRKGA